MNFTYLPATPRNEEAMLLARVIGEVVATVKHPTHEERKALLVQPVTLDGADYGPTLVSLDSVDAGVGDLVLVTAEGYSAMTSVGRGTQAPIDSAVIGVVDRVDLLPGSPR
ncbi:MAG: EutN/CcmL family microcompartment protein [Bryobacteraceae bacterium]|nr:EutN/CcmL family microcompartment protein [Bryobacteraceae bacterium]